MIKLNTKKVLEDREQERQKPKPLPKISLKRTRPPAVSINIPPNDIRSFVESSSRLRERIAEEANDDLLNRLEREYGQIRIERNKLSSQISMMVEGGASQDDLKDLYQKIEAFRIPLQQHYDKIAYVKQHGHLPEADTESVHEETLFELKDKKRKLVDKRCKLQRKLTASAKPSKPEQVANWELELEQATAEYNDVERRIKILEGKA